MASHWRWAAWLVGLAAWTFLLLSMDAAHGAGRLIPDERLRFPVAKLVHFVAYALLALAVPFLTERPRLRWGLVLLLLAHGALTEFGQLFVPGRTGTGRDALIDAAGVLTGLAAGRWLTARRA